VAFHDQLAQEWEAKYRRPSFRARAEFVKETLKGMEIQNKYWLDAGCGTGTLSRILAEQGCRVYGVDASPAMVEKARELECFHKSKIRFEIVKTIEELPLVSGTFDGVLCSSVIEYLKNPRQCLGEFHRILKKGGHLILSVPNRHSTVRLYQGTLFRLAALFDKSYPAYLKHVRNQYIRKEFEQLLAENGFSILEVKLIGPPWLQFLNRFQWFGTLYFFHVKKR